MVVLGLEAWLGLFGWWSDDGGRMIWKEGVRNVWCVFALVCQPIWILSSDILISIP